MNTQTLSRALELFAMGISLSALAGCAASPAAQPDPCTIDLNNPGPHQILVVVVKPGVGGVANAGGPAVSRRSQVTIRVEPDPAAPGHYVVSHDQRTDKDLPDSPKGR